MSNEFNDSFNNNNTSTNEPSFFDILRNARDGK